jgi:hypothetical protein
MNELYATKDAGVWNSALEWRFIREELLELMVKACRKLQGVELAL